MRLYSIYDEKAQVYNQPFYSLTDGAATREVAMLVRDTNSHFYHSPSDFTLYRIGVWDDAYGTVTSDEGPVLIMKLDALKELLERDR